MGESAHKPQQSGDAVPPAYRATVGRLCTIALSGEDMGSVAELSMDKALVAVWRQDGISQIAMDAEQ